MQLENRLSNEVGELQTFAGLKDSKGNLLAFLERDVVVSKLNLYWTVWFEPWALQWVLLIGKALNSFSIFNYLGVHVGAGEKCNVRGWGRYLRLTRIWSCCFKPHKAISTPAVKRPRGSKHSTELNVLDRHLRFQGFHPFCFMEQHGAGR